MVMIILIRKDGTNHRIKFLIHEWQKKAAKCISMYHPPLAPLLCTTMHNAKKTFLTLFFILKNIAINKMITPWYI